MPEHSDPESGEWNASMFDGRPTRLYARVDQHDDAPIVMLTGEVDLSTLPELRACLAPLEGRVIVDLYGVSFLDSSGIGVLVAARKALSSNGGDLMLRSPRYGVRRVLELTGLGAWVIGGGT
jgi:anti-anti-sigma factor